jgi:serine/threonine protein kinase
VEKYTIEVIQIITDGLGSSVILMPKYPLGSLADHNPTPRQSVTAFKQILLGLEQLKKWKILHRDIKPGNILVSNLEPFHVVLADFGMAGKYHQRRADYFYGTSHYMAPEIFDESAEIVDDKPDVWSTGIVMLEKMFKLKMIAKWQKYPQDKKKEIEESEKWYKKWNDEVLRKVKSIEAGRFSPEGLMKHMFEKIFVQESRNRLTAIECHDEGYNIGLWRQYSDTYKGDSKVRWVEGQPVMRK